MTKEEKEKTGKYFTLKPFINESREIAQAFTEFADNLEPIEKKYANAEENEDVRKKYIEPQESEDVRKKYIEPQESEDVIMGTLRNEMTIVHHYDKDELEKVREDAIKVFSQIIMQDASAEECIGVDEYIENMISPIMSTYLNQEYTFVINGDGSKFGWETSELFHEARMKWCEKHKLDVQNIVVINFGEGIEPSRIVFDG